ncbi:MAG TPA: hypothetical protein VMF88_10735 [Bacteroidota bacterium]|nr:hypothetical protein [Bacteroidota bacterium]
MPRKFYLLGHNPNTVPDAVQCLQDGANGLEPDVYYDSEKPEKFFVQESPAIWDVFSKTPPSLQEYLKDLSAQLLQNRGFNLALIAFDLKNANDFDIRALYDMIRIHFSNTHPKVAILTTVGESTSMGSVTCIQNQGLYESIGVDGGTTADQADDFFKNRNLHYTYGNGNSVLSSTLDQYVNEIRRATELRDAGNGNSFKMVYPWTVNNENKMKLYLDMPRGIDGMITGEVKQLWNILQKPEYQQKYCLATSADKPFS